MFTLNLHITISLDDELLAALRSLHHLGGPVALHDIHQGLQALIRGQSGIGEVIGSPPASPLPEVHKEPKRQYRYYRKGLFPPERYRLLKELYPSGTPRSEIRERLNALPGPYIAEDADVTQAAARWGIKRNSPDEAARPESSVATESEPGPAPIQTMAPAPEFVDADYNTVFQWAGQRGLASARSGMDLERVNDKRSELGLPKFRLNRSGKLLVVP